MERRIYEAAVEGSVISLLNLLQEDALLLDRIMVGCYAETPLHIASMLGHSEFVQEILNRKPELAGELDSRKSSPLHLAAAKGYLVIVKKLVSVNPEMCFARDRDGRNPVHIAAIKGHINVLRELVQVRPDAARVLMERGQTILHLCVRYNQFDSVKFLVETFSDRDIVNSKDKDGNNILHLAVADKQVEAIKFLITCGEMEVNARNANGLTAMDILARSVRDVMDWEIGELLRNAGGITAKDDNQLNNLRSTENRTLAISHSHDHEDYKETPESQSKGKDSKRIYQKREDINWIENKRNTILLVSLLIATMAFLAGLNPPGGVWQDSFPGNATTQPRKAGFAIMEVFDPDKYRSFIDYNTTSLVTSLGAILFLILASDLPFFRRKFFTWILMAIVWVAINSTILTYLISITTMSEEHSYLSVFYIAFVWACFTFGVLLVFVIRVIVWLVKVSRKLMRRRRRRLANTNGTSNSQHVV